MNIVRVNRENAEIDALKYAHYKKDATRSRALRQCYYASPNISCLRAILSLRVEIMSAP